MWPARWCWPHACRGSPPHSQRPTRTSASPTGWQRRSPRSFFLAYDIPGRSGGKAEVVGRPIPLAHLGANRDEARRRFRLGLRVPTVAVFGALAGATSLNEMAVAAWGDDGPAVLHVSGERDFAALRPRVARDDYVLMAQTDHFADVLAAADLAVSRAGGTVWSSPPPGLRRFSSRIPTPPPTIRPSTPVTSSEAEERSSCRMPRSRACPRSSRQLLADPERLEAMRSAMLAMARVDAADRIAEGVIALARS